MDETLCPVDYASAGQIVDDEVHDVLVKGLPRGVRLTAIVDCCHSATVLDLPYMYNVSGDLEIIENDRNEGIAKLVAAGARFCLDGNKKAAFSNVKDGFNLLRSAKGGGGNSSAREKTIRNKSTEADVICFAGCRDSQTSADATIAGKATGAMSHALISWPQEEQENGLHGTLARDAQVPGGKVHAGPRPVGGTETRPGGALHDLVSKSK